MFHCLFTISAFFFSLLFSILLTPLFSKSEEGGSTAYRSTCGFAIVIGLGFGDQAGFGRVGCGMGTFFACSGMHLCMILSARRSFCIKSLVIRRWR